MMHNQVHDVIICDEGFTANSHDVSGALGFECRTSDMRLSHMVFVN